MMLISLVEVCLGDEVMAICSLVINLSNLNIIF